MKGFVGIGRADHVETAITEATAGLKKADFLILIAPFSKIEAAAALLGEKYPGTPMIGTSGEGIAKEMRLYGRDRGCPHNSGQIHAYISCESTGNRTGRFRYNLSGIYDWM